MPDLPLELERAIFELAASTDVATALRLTIVARRVREWVEPILYSTVVAHAPKPRPVPRRRVKNPSKAPPPRKVPISPFMRIIALKPASFFARHVKSLHIAYLGEPELVTLLSTCTGISELGWWGTTLAPSVVAAFGSITLRRLSVDTSFNFGQTKPTLGTFATITHLDLIFREYGYPVLPPAHYFPALTHLSVAYDVVVPPSWCDDIFNSFLRLRILLLFCDSLFEEEASGSRELHADLRVVVMQLPARAWTTPWVHDAWALAESIVREQRELAAADKAAAELARSE
ncbi:hypothetical protein MSAN_01575800 [Mycena sanguinolenta]|uniref:Uncharacterized protein n=1 Tax=Mycena sanguinolenta TaxID=230812 RepID=A0A8H6XZX9_9AGAR|nr:hypothetical protein MSAN_01575800 [Mycena sanguinolenta]